MATIHREFQVDADVDACWSALCDVGAIHERLARGFVVHTALEGDHRTVTFAGGTVVRELLIARDDARRRLAYAVVDRPDVRHHASFQVCPGDLGGSRIVWITDVSPDAAAPAFAGMIDTGVAAIRRTLGAPREA
ncbi:Polyketide cyclase / dehydrase and lipid transport [Nannocystis exedens]|uniref:Polyketide cyclase / dehydrase and lipid transport n=1 Tax=Nannocystis exedens TaxID=54 RepID=A0A1I2F679_9BACT|nr:SRPBCC family protein [Nannocystis exedens]PCC73084.1 polyketide cyclase [Nannocystis exedens]SFF00479.1 Polyketide cyclase / dehydrase and lipid transport [Nannocystis exedens]